MLKLLSDAETARLRKAGEEACRLAAGGLDPSAAVAKVADEHGYNDDFADRLVNMFNVAKTNYIMQSTPHGPKRAESFDLADRDAVRAARQITETKAAHVAAEQVCQTVDLMAFDNSLPFSKAASDDDVDVDVDSATLQLRDAENRALHAIARLNVKVAEEWQRVHEAKDRRSSAVSRLVGYFKRATALPFAEVEPAVSYMYGPAGGVMLDVVAAELGSLAKRSSCTARKIADAKAEPYCLFADLLSRSQEYVATKKSAEARTAYKDSLITALGEARVKRASFFDDMLKGITGDAPVFEASKPHLASTASALDAYRETTNPMLRARLQGIQSEATIGQLLAEDEVLKRYDPQIVINAFNEVRKLAPAAVNNVVVARDTLRKYLERGRNPASRGLDMFEANQLQTMEKGYTDANNTSDLKMLEIAKRK